MENYFLSETLATLEYSLLYSTILNSLVAFFCFIILEIRDFRIIIAAALPWLILIAFKVGEWIAIHSIPTILSIF